MGTQRAAEQNLEPRIWPLWLSLLVPITPREMTRHVEEPSVMATLGVLDTLSPSGLCWEVEDFTESLCLHISGDKTSP